MEWIPAGNRYTCGEWTIVAETDNDFILLGPLTYVKLTPSDIFRAIDQANLYIVGLTEPSSLDKLRSEISKT